MVYNGKLLIRTVLDQVANSGFGLTFVPFNRIEAVVALAVDRLDVGGIYINRKTIGEVVGVQPFGGVGERRRSRW